MTGWPARACWAARLGGIGDEAALDIGGQISAQRELGWHNLELRTVDGTAVGDLPGLVLARAARRIRDAGLSVPCVDSRIGGWARPVSFPFREEIVELDACLRAAAAVGARYVRVMSYPNDGLSAAAWEAEAMRRLRLLAARAAASGVVLLHENCCGWAGTSAERALALVAAMDSGSLRLLFDIGNPIAHGYDGPAYLATVMPFVAHVHVKDAVAPVPGQEARFVPPGEGAARLIACVASLLQAGYQDVFSIEPHVAVLPHTGQRADPRVVTTRYLDYGRSLMALLDVAEAASGRAGSMSLAARGARP